MPKPDLLDYAYKEFSLKADPYPEHRPLAPRASFCDLGTTFRHALLRKFRQ